MIHGIEKIWLVVAGGADRALYLAVLAALWLAALPGFLAAEDGVTSTGAPVGSGWYTIACFVGAVLVLVVLHRGRPRAARRGGPQQTPQRVVAAK